MLYFYDSFGGPLHLGVVLVIILLTKTTTAQNEVALSYHPVRGLYFMAVIFATTIYVLCNM